MLVDWSSFSFTRLIGFSTVAERFQTDLDGDLMNLLSWAHSQAFIDNLI